MKSQLILITLISGFLCFSCNKKTIEIIKDSHEREVTDKKEKDVEIHQLKNIFTEGPAEFAYELVIYSDENGTLTKNSPFFYGTSENYDRANYKWVNDSTLILKLYNFSGTQELNQKYVVHRDGSQTLEVYPEKGK